MSKIRTPGMYVTSSMEGKELPWNDIIDAIYFNLGDRATPDVVQFAIDIKSGISHFSNGAKPNYDLGLISDHALMAEIAQSYPEDDFEYLYELTFFRSFIQPASDLDAFEEWVKDVFEMHADYIWINGVMTGGICFPQETDEDSYPPLLERLSLSIYKPD
ncbi:MAG: hypothetical protein JJ934_19455 [Pseudomonadales bacterium]|nr:hypothetical protein [Pseudomonadales bacterium]